MKPNKEKLLERINNMKSICVDGKKEIKGLIGELIGEPLETEANLFNAGDVFEGEIGIYIPIEWGVSTFVFLGFGGDPLKAFSDEPMYREQVVKRLKELGAKKIGHLKVEIFRD